MSGTSQSDGNVARIFKMQAGVFCLSLSVAALGLGIYFGGVRNNISAMDDAACDPCSSELKCRSSDSCGVSSVMRFFFHGSLIGLIGAVLVIALVLFACARNQNVCTFNCLCCCNFTLFAFGIIHVVIIVIGLLSWGSISDDIANQKACNYCKNSPGILKRAKLDNAVSGDERNCDYSSCLKTYNSHKDVLPYILVGGIVVLLATILATLLCAIVGCYARSFHSQAPNGITIAVSSSPAPAVVVGQPVTIVQKA